MNKLLHPNALRGCNYLSLSLTDQTGHSPTKNLNVKSIGQIKQSNKQLSEINVNKHSGNNIP